MPIITREIAINMLSNIERGALVDLRTLLTAIIDGDFFFSISELPTAATLAPTDELVAVQDSVAVRVEYDALLNQLANDLALQFPELGFGTALSLPQADIPLGGDEVIEVWQDGIRKQTILTASAVVEPPVDVPVPFDADSWTLSTNADGSTRITIVNRPTDTTVIERQYDGGAWVNIGGLAVGAYDNFTKCDGTELSVKVRVKNSLGTTATAAKTTTASGAIVHTFKTLFLGQVHLEYDASLLATGLVGSFPSTGRFAKTLSNATTTQQPTKDATGLKFAAGVTQYLRSQGAEPADEIAPYAHRGGCVIFEVDDDATTGSWTVFNAHGTANNVAGQRQPHITVSKSSSLISVAWVNGSNVSYSCTIPLVAGKNFFVWQRMGHRMHARGNGSTATVTASFTSPRVPTSGLYSMGATTAQTFDAWLNYNAVWDGELTSAEFDAAEGLAAHMANRLDLLSGGHTYKVNRPKFGDTIARHPRQKYIESEWLAYNTSIDASRYSHRGKSTVIDTDDWEVMIESDFTTAGEVPVNRHSAIKHLYSTPYWLNRGAFASTDNCSAHAGNGGAWPNTVVLDTTADTDDGNPGIISGTGMLSLRMLWDSGRGGWNTGEIATVTDGGQGRTWGGGDFYMASRFRFTGDTQTQGAPLFPGWWGYGRKHLIWWADERSEFDNFEGTGKDRRYYDSNIHMHVGNRTDNRVGDPGIGSQSSNPATSHHRIGGYTLIPANGFTPEINTRDGFFHLSETIVFDGWVYGLIDGKEVYRVEIGPQDHWHSERYFIWDHTKSSAHGDRVLATNEIPTFDIDTFVIKYPADRLDDVLTGFSARPSVARAGNVLTITTNLSAASAQTDIYWYRNGLPITTAGLSGELTHTVDPAVDVGAVIWAGVQPMFVSGQPTMYTNKLTIT